MCIKITIHFQKQDMDNQTPEERQVRLKKADSIRRMLAEQSGPAGNAMNSLGDSGSSLGDQSTMSAEVRQQMDEEKRQREHLLGLNQLIAQQVKERSRMVAGKFSQQNVSKFAHLSYKKDFASIK